MKLSIERVKLKDLVKASLEVVSPLMSQKPEVESTVSISDDVPEFFAGDVIKLKQILVNLLSNAVKFTNRGRIALHVGMETNQDIAKVSNGPNVFLKSWANGAIFIKFSVQDTGIGVAKKDFPRIAGTYSNSICFTQYSVRDPFENS